MFGVARPNLDQVAVVAGHEVDLEHFGEGGERLRDALLAWAFGASNRDKRQHALTQGTRIDLGSVPPDDPAGFQLTNPLEDGRWRQPDRPSDIGLSLARIALKNPRYLYINIVDYLVLSHSIRIIC